jgi:hypothetical protein
VVIQTDLTARTADIGVPTITGAPESLEFVLKLRMIADHASYECKVENVFWDE